MNRLTLFGGAVVDTSDGPLGGRAAQRHRIALLALLTCGRRAHRSREQLMTMLWPEADGERGRRLLSDSIYRINEALGGDVITGSGEDVRLDRQRLASDVADLEAAADAAQWACVVDAYTGPLLDGFYLPAAAAFDRWMEVERDRYARSVAKAHEALAISARAAGRASEAVEWWQRLAAMMPEDSRVAMELMRALDACGQRALALRHARVHAAILRETLGMEPDSAVEALAGSLAAPTAATPSVTLMKREDVQVLAESPRKSGESRNPVSESSVAVLPFAGISEAADDLSLARGLSEEVAHALMRTPGLRVASHTSVMACRARKLDALQVARRLRVEWIIEGSVRRSGEVLRIGVQLTAAASGYQVWSESYDRRTGDAFAVQAEVAAAVAMRIPSCIAVPGEERRLVIV